MSVCSPLDITPVILAGGKGRRLRPLTSKRRPKPFLHLFSNQSLLQESAARVSHLSDPLVICDEQYVSRAAAELSKAQIIAEPHQRSTAPAITIAALMLADENVPMLVMPSDHYIGDIDAFHQAITAAYEVLSDDNFVILGAQPTGADTRYGYIHSENDVLLSFLEKPSKARAKMLYKQAQCLWNTGIFITRPQTFLHAMSAHAPDMLEKMQAAHAQGAQEGVIFKPAKSPYWRVQGQAVDYAVMEHLHADSARVVNLDAGWSDIGCWPALIALKLRQIFYNPS